MATPLPPPGTGGLDAAPRAKLGPSDRERFERKIQKSADGCWTWISSKSKAGYGRFYAAGRMRTAHRVAYELFVGSIPEGLVLDHLCRNHACVNPAHLEPVTDRENVLRGVGVTAENSRLTACRKGHPFDPENTVVRSEGWRKCLTCAREDWTMRNPKRRRGRHRPLSPTEPAATPTEKGGAR